MVFMPPPLTAFVGPFGLVNTRSLGLGSPKYLSRTQVAGSQQIFTLSWWINFLGTLPSGSNNWWVLGTAGTHETIGILANGGQVYVINYFSNGNGEQWGTITGLISTNTWHHCVCHVDSTNGTAGDRLRMWFDGVELTTFGRDTQPSLNRNSVSLNTNGNPVNVGRTTGGTGYLNSAWLIDEVALIDGQALTAAPFRDGDGLPADLGSLTFGANGFWQRYESAAASTDAGIDSSPAANHYAENSVVDGDSSTNAPS